MAPIAGGGEGTCADAPPNCGLLVSLDSEGVCWMRFVADSSLELIHPHIRVPATLQDPVELGGGGSGVVVFSGADEVFGDVVLKHGGHKDTAELFALATIEEQLRQRGREKGAEDAANFMVAQTPDFRFLYISQDHLLDRGVQLWGVVKESMLATSQAPTTPHAMWSLLHRTLLAPQSGGVSPSAAAKPPRGIRLRCGGCLADGGARRRAPVEFVDNRLEVSVPLGAEPDELGRVRCTARGEGYQYLQSFFRHLEAIQKKRCWKFTLAQKTIGGASPATGSLLLAAGKLNGDCLQTLIREITVVIGHLRQLTLPEEALAIEEVRRVVASAEAQPGFGPADVPQLVDAYVGFAVRKNFHPTAGRFKRLRDWGGLFRSGKLILDEGERLPAKQLGALLQPGAFVEDVFASGPRGPSALERNLGSWRDVLRQATAVRGDAALARVWTCGLSDCGLHNLFLGEDRLWMFDMGEPSLTALPAFLTKFLMSFFHTLGMEETTCGSWVNRFVPAEGGRCSLSAATVALLPQALEAFRAVLDALTTEVFGGEDAVRQLLMRYVVLQLLSDAAFCLERWEQKGGGRERLRPQAHGLEKWLWRALWDLYVSTEVAGQDWTPGSG